MLWVEKRLSAQNGGKLNMPAPEGADLPAPEGAYLPAADSAYLPALDGLRAISIAFVLGAHAGLDHVLPGAFGVTLFFFISGWLITRQLLAGLDRRGQVGFGRFYARRALRLMPAAVMYTLLAGTAYLGLGGHISPAGAGAAVFYGANYYDLWAGYHSTVPGVRHPFNILWSLAIEEHFYLVWPACLALTWRRRHLFAALLLLCVAILLWRATLFHLCFVPGAPAVCGPTNPNPLWAYNRLYLATDTRLDSIAFGAALAIATWQNRAFVCRAAGGWALPALGVALLFLSFACPGSFARHVLRPTLQGTGLMLTFPAILARPSLATPLANPALVLIGRLSYALYLWHWGAMMLADRFFPAGHTAAWVMTTLPLAVILALLSYTLIERPMLRLRRHFGSAAPDAFVTHALAVQETLAP